MSENIQDEDDYFDEISSALVSFPADVEAALEEVFPSTDPLDQKDFNAIEYINSLFPTEQSLTNLDDVVAKMHVKLLSIDEGISDVVRSQSSVSEEGRAALEEAQKMIRQLNLQITDIKCKAEQSEETVREITRDIKQLDCAKKNLTSAITTLNHLHILVDGVETLRTLTVKREYGEIVMHLQAIVQVMEHFKSYTDINKIKELATQVKEIQNSLATQITADFHDAFEGPNSKNFVPTRQMAEACLVVSILESKVKRDLLKWLVEIQLREYSVLFHESEEVAWLDKLDKRYAWFKNHLLMFERKFGSMFPPEWNVSERITVEFCNMTRKDLSSIMAKRKNEIDVKLLLYAIQKSVDFERLLAKRFSGVTLREDSHKTDNKENTQPVFPFAGVISECFQAYLNIYIESVDRNLMDLMERFVADSKGDLSKEQGLPGTTVNVLPSCADLFVFYKKCLVQCTQLSNGNPMLSLANTFQKYLREYSSKVLESNLPKASGPSSLSLTNVRDFKDFSMAAGLFQNLLKEGDVTKFTRQEQARVCCILTTAEYCLETTQQLEEKLKEKIEPSLAEKVNLAQEQDMFHKVISSCINLLVSDVETVCEPALAAMCKIQWANVEVVGDQSGYVAAITAHLRDTIPQIRDNLNASRKYFTQFCIRFVKSFIPKFMQSVYKCKPLSTAAAEQLIVDAHTLKMVLLDLPSIGSSVVRKPHSAFTNVVVERMPRIEMILKVVMNVTSPNHDFIDEFLSLLPDGDIQEFTRVLEMKGLKTAEKNQLLMRFKTLKPNISESPKHDAIRKLNSQMKKC